MAIYKKLLTGSEALKILNSDEMESFVDGYIYFGKDGNADIYRDWISSNIPTSNSKLSESIFKLAGNELIDDRSLVDFGFLILRGRYSCFTKLECLVYFLKMKSLLRPGDYMESTRLGQKHTSNRLVRFQSLLNRAAHDEKKVPSLIRALKRTEYPTLFYRTANLLWLLPQKIATRISDQAISVVETKSFSQAVKIELVARLSEND